MYEFKFRNNLMGASGKKVLTEFPFHRISISYEEV